MVSKKTKTVKKVIKKKLVKKTMPVKKAIKKKPIKNKVVVKKVIKKTMRKIVTAKKKSTVSKVGILKKNNKFTRKRKLNKKSLVIAIGDRCFWVKDGPSVRDLADLRNVLLEISKEQFLYHANGMKNDFAVWTEEVLYDKKCADSIRKSKTISAMVKNIEKFLSVYNY